MIVFSAIMPHPPESVPGVGNEEHLSAIKNTLDSFEVLRERFEKSRPDTVVIISPHAHMESYTFVINSAADLSGTFANFGFDRVYTFKNDIETADKISYCCLVNEMESHLHPDFLDHGTLVPLFQLTRNIKPKVVQLSFSLGSYEQHYRYGELIGSILEKDESKRYAIIASADLSHRLTPDSPAGYSESAKNFDREVVRLLASNNLPGLFRMQSGAAKEAAECGMRSIVILLGILHEKNYAFNLLSYEGPFGIGYMVAEYA